MRGKPRSESELLEMISRELPPAASDVLTGIGDDCAVVRSSSSPGVLELLKTDALVEGVHFNKNTPWYKVGWKALCRPISDIAAMGGSPLHAMITVAAPPDWRSETWKSLYRGIGKVAREYGVSIVGGETVSSPGPVFLSVSLTGEVPKKNLRLRSGAKPGDLICITGKLGGSFKSGRHLTFHPRLAEGRWLGSEQGVSSMMDLSDGLGSDLPKLARQSSCSFRIAPDLIPRHKGCSVEAALSDGEDYELLITVNPRSWPALQSRWARASLDLPLTPIGVMLDPSEASSEITAGYDHLSSKRPRHL